MMKNGRSPLVQAALKGMTPQAGDSPAEVQAKLDNLYQYAQDNILNAGKTLYRGVPISGQSLVPGVTK